ncbi:MAG: hypothetical protein GX066_02045 [Clostridiaceae bacterium]|nr:hypothetical protein [Clostridiaceae bacterium]
MKNISSYGYGMFVLSALCFIGGFSSMAINPYNPYGLGIIFMGLFLFLQYLKKLKRVPAYIIRLLSWIVAAGFFVVDIALVVMYISGR